MTACYDADTIRIGSRRFARSVSIVMITYEQKLDRDLRWALLEGSMHFEKESAVYKSCSGSHASSTS